MSPADLVFVTTNCDDFIIGSVKITVSNIQCNYSKKDTFSGALMPLYTHFLYLYF